MPPEQLPWDRRDFRKHERSASDPRFGGGGFGGGGPHRWREQHHHAHAPPPPPPHPPPYHHHHQHNHQQQQQQRWYSDFRSSRPIPSGPGKQGGWHAYPDDAGHGFLPFGSRYGDRHLEDDNFLPLGSRNDGRYFRGRENRGSFSQKDWRSTSWEPAASSCGPVRPTTATEVNNQKSAETSETCQNNSKSNDSSHPLPVSTSDQSLLLTKEREKNDGTPDGGGASSGQKSEKENGLESGDWKPLKWTRSGSLPSRGSSFSQLSGTKSTGVVDSTERVAEVQQKDAMPVQSPTSKAITTAPASCDDTGCRKKPRLGWGEGLAKYEKKKVEGPEDGAAKEGLVVSVIASENVQSPSFNLSEKSPRVASMSDCASPATPSSVACSSSPGTEEKESITPTNVDQETVNLSCSPSIAPKAHYEGPTFNLENVDLASVAKLSSFLSELLQSEDPNSVKTDYVQTTSLEKLLIWKVDILKALEVTESRIDSLETELKSLIAEPRSCCPCPDTSSSLPGECPLKPCKEVVVAATAAAFQGVTSGSMNVENVPAVEEHEALKKEINSPGSATCKITDSSGEGVCPATTECKSFFYLDLKNSSNLNLSVLVNGPSTEVNSYHVDAPIAISESCHNANAGNVHWGGDCNYASIVASNKDFASSALEELNKLLPSRQCFSDISIASNVSPVQRSSSVIKEKFLARKRSLKFKEKVIMLKFKVFQHFWKEGRMISVRKLRGKTQKMLDMSQSGHKRNRSSGRSRIPCFAGNHRTVSAEEVIKFVNGLLSEASFNPCRNTLKMPALILDKEVKASRFISNNGLVEDPRSAEKQRSIINPWTAEEREAFIDKLAIFGKNFRKIASFLEHKTIADCIEFYYKNQKSECFARARKKPEFSEQRKSQATTYLVATGKRWNREVNAASLGVQFGKASRAEIGPLQRSNSLEIYSNETVAADVLAGICGSLSSEAMNSCITSSFDHADGHHQDWKCPRVGLGSKRPLTPDCMQNAEEEYSDESYEEMDSADWTDEEKSVFVQAVSIYGKDFDMISQLVGTKSKEQCKIFFSKARKCLGLDQIHHGAGNAISGDNNGGGGSDIEDGCVVQAGAIICVNVSECKMEENLPPPKLKGNHEMDAVAPHDLKPEVTICGEDSKDRIDPVAVEPFLESSSTDDKPAADCEAAHKGKSDRLPNKEEGSNSDKEALLDSVGEESEGKEHVLHDENLNGKKVDNRDVNSSEVTAIGRTSEVKSHLLLAGTVDAFSSVQAENISAEKSHVGSSLENGRVALKESSTVFSLPMTTFQRHSSNNALACVGMSTISEKHSPLETVTTLDQQHLLGYKSPEVVDSPKVLRGYPVSANEINGHTPDWDQNLHSNRQTDFSIQRCTRPPSYSWSDSENKPSRNGDVKLFGKVLITSQQQKPNSCVQESSTDNTNLNKASSQSLNLGYPADSMAAFDCNKFIGSENIPVKTLGFPSMPDSTLLLTKYPAAFGSHSKATGKLELPSLQRVVSDRPVTVFQRSRDLNSSNGVAEFQVLKNRDLQPPQEGLIFSDMQRRNMFDPVQEVQHEARGMIGIGVGVVSDPVAAIKMQYSKPQNIRTEDGDTRKINGGESRKVA